MLAVYGLNAWVLTALYLKNKDNLSDGQGQEMLDVIHQGIQSRGILCLPCHNQENPMIDFEKLGYSPSRNEFLKNSPIARRMQLIEQGEEFFVYPHLEGETE